jgi:hypothetical protein
MTDAVVPIVSPSGAAAWASPLALTVFYDIHCPYSDRVLGWLDELQPGLVETTFRAFPLEQVNHDPTAASWRIWDQPLDYEHYRGRPQRRSLRALLAITLVGTFAPRDVTDQFRLAVSHARHSGHLDVSQPALLLELAAGAGADAGALQAGFEDPGALAAARDRLRQDWEAAGAEYEIFGVPTLQVAGRPPFYLRLERTPQGGAATALLETIRDLPERLPQVLELKVPERVAHAAP